MPEDLNWRHLAKDVAHGLGQMAKLPFSQGKLRDVPTGNQHPVLILPGFMTTDSMLSPLHGYLTRIGYRSYPWNLGINLGYTTMFDIERLIAKRVQQVLEHSGAQSLTLLGWSLGGIYAKALARKYPQLIRDVITLGSPIVEDLTQLQIGFLYGWVSNPGYAAAAVNVKLKEAALPLYGTPLTAIYSPNDGVVPVSCALQQGPMVQNVAVDATHLGMVYDPYVYYLIAHRLAQCQAGDWQPLDLTDLHARFHTATGKKKSASKSSRR